MLVLLASLLSSVGAAASATAGGSPAELLSQGDAAFAERFDEGRMEDAIFYYEEVLPILPVQSEGFVLNRLAQCYYELTTFSPGNTPDDRLLFEKGKEYGLRSLRLNPDFARLEDGDFKGAVSYITDPAALLWTANNWGGLFSYDPLLGMIDVGKVKALYERGIEVAEDYWGASFHNALGAMLVTLPQFLGGSAEKGRDHLERAIEISPDYLENHVVYAQYWGFTYDPFGRVNGIRDPDLVERELDLVLSGEIGDWPFWNREAKKEAAALLKLKGELEDEG